MATKVTKELINHKSIVVVGASNDVTKPGGAILRNIIEGGFKGELHVVNPKEDLIQGVNCTKDIKDLPKVDLAVLAIAAKFSEETVRVLAEEKNTKAFIIISAGFGEESHEGKELENRIVNIIERNIKYVDFLDDEIVAAPSGITRIGGTLPSGFIMEEDDMEEERRLCYVGITRAKYSVAIVYEYDNIDLNDCVKYKP